MFDFTYNNESNVFNYKLFKMIKIFWLEDDLHLKTKEFWGQLDFTH